MKAGGFSRVGEAFPLAETRNLDTAVPLLKHRGGGVRDNMSRATKTKKVIAGALAACAISAVSFAVAPVATAAATHPAAGMHTYNPSAPLGSADNPIILGGGSPLLTEAQQKLSDQAKEQLATTKGEAKAATSLQPLTNNCGDSGFYYCYEVTSTIGWVKDGTILGSDNHEYAEAEGGGKNSNDWGVYMDQSTDGGSTWSGHINELINGTEWSNPIYDGPGYVVRACLTDYQHNLYVCTPWH